MTSEEFKKEWNPGKLNRWTEFNSQQLGKTNFTSLTKDFLKNGFPEDSAPFLNFGLRSYDWEFYTISEYYSDYGLDSIFENYWIFGSDGSGNPICIDTGSNDKIILLDHEQDFEPIQDINKNVIELAQCLIEFKKFIAQVNSEFGEDGFIESKFSKKHISDLRKQFETINPNIFIESDFWYTEIENLNCEIE